MGPAHVFEFSPDRVPWNWAFGDRGKAVLLQSLGGPQNRALQAMTTCGGLTADGAMWVGGPDAPPPPPKPALDVTVAAAAAADAGTAAAVLAPPPSPKLLQPLPASDSIGGGGGPALVAALASAPLRLSLADLAVTFCQLVLFIAHYRRRLQEASCAVSTLSLCTTSTFSTNAAAATTTVAAAAYPCAAPGAARIGAILGPTTPSFSAALQLQLLLPLTRGELWAVVPLLVMTAAAVLAVAAMRRPRGDADSGVARLRLPRFCMVAVGLLPKAASLVTLLAAWPSGELHSRSSHLGTYLRLEAVIMVWQQAARTYPLWQGLAVLAVHCTLATAICITAALPRLQAAAAAGAPPPPAFRPLWVLTQTYACAALAACVALQQHRLLRAAALRSSNRGGGGVMPLNGSGGGAAVGEEHLQFMAAIRGLLCGNGSNCSGGSAASASFTMTTGSASRGSSAAPSESGTAAGSGSHTTAAGVAQAVVAAAVGTMTIGFRPDAAGLTKTSSRITHQQQHQYPPQDGRVAGPTACVTPLTGEGHAKPMSPEGPGAAVHIPYASANGRAMAAPAPLPPPSGALPPAGAFSLKQPMGLSKWTIVEDQEFQAPAAVGVGVSVDALGRVSSRGRRFRRYQSRAPPQRVHMKLPWAEPDQLPGNFLERLNLALSEGLDCMAVGVSVRAGCIELVFDIVPQAAFDSASDYRAGQSRRRHVRQHQQHHDGRQPAVPGTAGAAAPPPQRRHQPLLPSPLQHQQVAEQQMLLQLLEQPPRQQQHRPMGHLDLLGQAGELLGAEALGAAVGATDAEGSEAAAAAAEAAAEDPHGALEAAVLSGLLRDADPASWINALHLQPPPGAEVLTQACGRVWISRWDPMLRQWVPEKVGGIRPSQLPRITQLTPPCLVVAAAAARPGGKPIPSAAAVVRVTVTNAGGATPPAFSARCRGRYLPVVARRVRGRREPGWRCVDNDGDRGRQQRRSDASSPDELLLSADPFLAAASLSSAATTTFELELPAGLPRNGLVVLECKVGKLLSNWRPLIVTEDAAMAAELASLLNPPLPAAATAAAAIDPALDDADADGGAAGWDDLANDLGLWQDYLEVLGLTTAAAASGAAAATEAGTSGGGGSAAGVTEAAAVPLLPGSLDLGPGLAALYATEGYGAHMAGIGATLLEFAVDRGWTHTAGLLVRQLLSAGLSWDEVLRRCSSDGLTLLHRAVRSGRSEAVELVVRLGEEHGTPFDWQAVSAGVTAAEASMGEVADGNRCGGGAGGVTPLHLAASLPDGGRLAERILREYHAACQLWASAVDGYGLRPVDCARASGHMHLDGAPAGAAGAAAAVAAVPPPPPPSAGAAAPAVGAPSGTVASSATASSVGLVSCGGGAASPRGATPRAALLTRVRTRTGLRSALATAVAAVVAALRGTVELLAAPFVNDPQVESAYVRAVGSEFILWCCSYAVFQICTVAAVAGRMVKELRVHEVWGMVLFCSSHLVGGCLLCSNYGAWLRLRERLWVAVTLARTLPKLLPVLGLLPYPNSATNYLSGGMDVVLEGLVPAYFERMRAPFVLPLRAFEGIATGLLYRSHQVQLLLAPPGFSPMAYALAWNLGCAVLTATLDAACRRRFAAAAASATPTASRQGGVIRARGVAAGAGARAAGGALGAAEAAAGGKGKKVE